MNMFCQVLCTCHVKLNMWWLHHHYKRGALVLLQLVFCFDFVFLAFMTTKLFADSFAIFAYLSWLSVHISAFTCPCCIY